jgi:hypothetical protein
MRIDFHFETDGDFYLDKNYFDTLLKRIIASHNLVDTHIYGTDYDSFWIGFTVKFVTEPQDKDLLDKMVVRDFTEAIVKSVRFNHMFLMRYLYELSEKVRHWAFHETDKPVFEEFWSGNYDGTEFIITR